MPCIGVKISDKIPYAGVKISECEKKNHISCNVLIYFCIYNKKKEYICILIIIIKIET